MRHGATPVLHGSADHASIHVFMRNTPILALKTPGAADHAIPDEYRASSGAGDASMRGRCYTGGTRERIRSAAPFQWSDLTPFCPEVVA